MRKSISILFCFFAFCLFSTAQNSSIIDELNSAKTGQGKITIYQEDALKRLVGSTIVSNRPSVSSEQFTNQLNTTTDTGSSGEKSSSSKNFVRAMGYRIQVYSGRDQKHSKTEAQSRRNTIVSAYPNMEVNVTYNSPTWYVKAGNFKTHEQASIALKEMKVKFPGFGREMNIIRDTVKIPVE